MRAGEQLHTTPQTLSGQIKLLEDWLGRKLFQKSGRNLELTEDGRLALGYADQIFSLGAELENVVRLPRGVHKVLDFKVGGMVLALKCGLPVAPLVMEGTGKLLPKKSLFFNPDQPVRLRALPPVDTGRRVKR